MSGEGEDGVENDIESDIQHTRRRPLLPRTSKDSSEPIEQETVIIAEKTFNQRSSYRIIKRTKRDPSPVDQVIKKAVNSKQTSTPVSKTRRPWELWSVEDKNSFFEALCEFGKDFENIQSYIAQKGRKKGFALNMIKNKDQVRHFYYRTWHKISKFLQISESVTKQTQELYGLINYGELRKKIGGCLNEKNRQKLNELVFSGVTIVKHKGKKLRIKTPVCRALKKLNNVSDTKEPETEKLPKDIIVEFQPHTNSAFLQVQSLAQNPRIRTKISLQKRLKPVIEFLQQRWKPYRLKRKEQILASLPCLASQEICDSDSPPVLRVKPPRDAKIFPLSLSILDIASSSDVCLEKFIKLSHNTVRKDTTKSKKSLCLNQKILNDKQSEICDVGTDKLDSVSDIVSECSENTPLDAQDVIIKSVSRNNSDDSGYINVLTPPKSVPEEISSDIQVETSNPLPSFSSILESTNKRLSNNENEITENSEEKVNNFSVNSFRVNDDISVNSSEEGFKDALLPKKKESEIDTILQNISENAAIGDVSCSKANQLFSNICQKNDLLSIDVSQTIKVEEEDESDSIFVKTIKNGWTTEEAGYLTFGEIYLLLGKPAKIVLEYEFEPPEAIFLHHDKDIDSSHSSASEMNIMLNKLCDMAQVYFTDSKSKQILNKQHGRNSKSSKLKLPLLSEKVKDMAQDQLHKTPLMSTNMELGIMHKDMVFSKDKSSSKSSVNSSGGVNTALDKHVFIRPVGTAPRNIKPADQNSLKEEIGKLLPSTRRGCRVRRKPLVVQRPLLPREGMGVLSGPRPMTLVQLVPSISSLSPIISSNCTQSEKLNIAPTKKIVKLIPSGSPLDIKPIQVPVISQVQSDSGQDLVLQQNSLAQQVILNPTTRNSLQIISDQSGSQCLNSVNSVVPPANTAESVTDVLSSLENSTFTSGGLPSPTSLDVLNFDLLADSHQNSTSEKNFITMSSADEYHPSEQSDSLSSISAIPDTTFLEELGFSTKTSLFDSSLATSYSDEQLTSKPLLSPPGSPTHQPFIMHSPDRQWLNGEGPDMSLNTFLNSIESPVKVMSTSTYSSFTENSNFDQIARLAPVVDSQVRCLLDECSIDFIAKFEDLADVINNSSSDDGKPT